MFRSPLKFQGRAKSKVRKRWWLCHAMDFESLMYPCFFFCLILGVFPYKINASTFEISRIRYVISIAVACLFCCYEVLLFYQCNIAGIIEYDNVPESLQDNCYFLLGGFIVIVTYILNKQRMQLLQNVLDVSSRLPSESFRKLSQLIHVKDIFGFLFLFGQIPNCISVTLPDTFAKLCALYITLLVFQMDMLYMNCVCVLKACFKRINDNLASMRELVTNDEPHLLRRIYHEQRNPFLLMELKALKKRHLMISDTVQLLNIIFSLQLLATIVLTFAEITFSLYFFIIQGLGNKIIGSMDKQFWYTDFGTSTMYYAIKIMLIVWACETGRDQALKIGTTIHEVLISTSDKQIKDEVVKKHLISTVL